MLASVLVVLHHISIRRGIMAQNETVVEQSVTGSEAEGPLMLERLTLTRDAFFNQVASIQRGVRGGGGLPEFALNGHMDLEWTVPEGAYFNLSPGEEGTEAQASRMSQSLPRQGVTFDVLEREKVKFHSGNPLPVRKITATIDASGGLSLCMMTDVIRGSVASYWFLAKTEPSPETGLAFKLQPQLGSPARFSPK
jgi:hypothetical protein